MLPIQRVEFCRSGDDGAVCQHQGKLRHIPIGEHAGNESNGLCIGDGSRLRNADDALITQLFIPENLHFQRFAGGLRGRGNVHSAVEFLLSGEQAAGFAAVDRDGFRSDACAVRIDFCTYLLENVLWEGDPAQKPDAGNDQQKPGQDPRCDLFSVQERRLLL